MLASATVTPASASTTVTYDLAVETDYTLSDASTAEFASSSVKLSRISYSVPDITRAVLDPDPALSTTAVAGDLDGDGDLDIYMAVWGGPNRMWINQGGAQGGVIGSFAAADIPGDDANSYGAIFGDFDNDGDLDIHVQNPGRDTQNNLWLNQGGVQGGQEGTFASADIPGDIGRAPAASVGDVDNDGDLDFYVGNFASGTENRLWINQGGAQSGTLGTFSATNLPSDSDRTYGSTMIDIDGDGDLDIYSAGLNRNQNNLWINQGGAQEGTIGMFVAQNIEGDLGNSFWTQAGDVDGDGDYDLYAVDQGGQNRLWINQGGAQGGSPTTFEASDITGDNGDALGATMADIDGDGDLDIYVPAYDDSVSNLLWINDGSNSGGAAFSPVEFPADEGFSVRSLIEDFNQDGQNDILVTNWGSEDVLWMGNDAFLTTAVTPKTPVAFPISVTGFEHQVDPEGTDRVSYQVSSDGGLTWNYWDGTAWTATTSSDGAETSSVDDVDAHIESLDTDGGEFLWRAFLSGDAPTTVELFAVDVTVAELPVTTTTTVPDTTTTVPDTTTTVPDTTTTEQTPTTGQVATSTTIDAVESSSVAEPQATPTTQPADKATSGTFELAKTGGGMSVAVAGMLILATGIMVLVKKRTIGL